MSKLEMLSHLLLFASLITVIVADGISPEINHHIDISTTANILKYVGHILLSITTLNFFVTQEYRILHNLFRVHGSWRFQSLRWLRSL